jgi:hypothetical protein
MAMSEYELEGSNLRWLVAAALMLLAMALVVVRYPEHTEATAAPAAIATQATAPMLPR